MSVSVGRRSIDSWCSVIVSPDLSGIQRENSKLQLPFAPDLFPGLHSRHCFIMFWDFFSHMWTQCITTMKFHLSTCLKNETTEQVCVWEGYEILGMCLHVCVCVWAAPSAFVLCLLLFCITHCLYTKQVTSNIWDAVEIGVNRPSKVIQIHCHVESSTQTTYQTLTLKCQICFWVCSIMLICHL